MSKESKPQGIAIRYSDTIKEKVVDTIKEHNDIYSNAGEVFVGKFGQPIAQRVVDEINDGKKDFFIILVKKSSKDRKYVAHKAKIRKGFRSRPDTENIPDYYKNSSYVKVWFQLENKLTKVKEEHASRFNEMREKFYKWSPEKKKRELQKILNKKRINDKEMIELAKRMISII